MVIDFTGLPASQTASTRARATEQSTAEAKGNGAAASAPSPSGKGDTVKLSDAAQALQNVQAKLADTPDVDSDRVAELKAQIENGSYEINASGIAKGMAKFEQLLS